MKAAAITPNGFMPEARGTNPVRCNTHGYQDNTKARMTNVANGFFFKVFDGDSPLDSENGLVLYASLGRKHYEFPASGKRASERRFAQHRSWTATLDPARDAQLT